jgi:hypothetical protein
MKPGCDCWKFGYFGLGIPVYYRIEGGKYILWNKELNECPHCGTKAVKDEN